MAIKNKMNQGSGIMTTDEAMLMASMDENEEVFMRLVDDFMERGFSLQEAIEAAKEEFENKSSKISAPSIKMAEGYSPGDYDPLIVEEYEKYKYDAEEQGQPVISIDEFLRLARTEAMGGGLMRMNYQDGTLPRSMMIDTTTSAYGDAGKGRDVPAFLKEKRFEEMKRLEDMIKKARREKSKRTKGGVASILGE